MNSELPALETWMQLFGLGSLIPDLFAGKIGPSAADDAILAVRDDYPDVSQDYVALLDQALSLTAMVRRSIEDQNQAIAAFNGEAAAFQLFFGHDPDRLLTEDETALLDEIEARLARLLADQEREFQRTEREAEELQNEIADLQAEATDLVEDALREIAEASLEVEAAQADYEEALARADETHPEAAGSSDGDGDFDWEDPFEDEPDSWDWTIF